MKKYLLWWTDIEQRKANGRPMTQKDADISDAELVKDPLIVDTWPAYLIAASTFLYENTDDYHHGGIYHPQHPDFKDAPRMCVWSDLRAFELNIGESTGIVIKAEDLCHVQALQGVTTDFGLLINLDPRLFDSTDTKKFKGPKLKSKKMGAPKIDPKEVKGKLQVRAKVKYQNMLIEKYTSVQIGIDKLLEKEFGESSWSSRE